jgi:hypothetical protein
MEHVAIDLRGRESKVCVRAADGTILEEKSWPTRQLREYLRSRPASRVIVEMCDGAFVVANVATELGHEARIVPATLLRSLGVGLRRSKRSGRDAQVLSEVSCRIDLPSVPMGTADLRTRKTMCAMREALVEARAKLIRSVLRVDARRRTRDARLRSRSSAGPRARRCGQSDSAPLEADTHDG